MSHRLYRSAKRGDLEGVRREVYKGTNVNWKNPSRHYKTALHGASKNCQLEVVKELLSYPQINPNLEDLYGWTPLCCASHKGHTEVVKALLQHPKTNNATMQLAMRLAARRGHEQVIKELNRPRPICLTPHSPVKDNNIYLNQKKVGSNRGHSQVRIHELKSQRDRYKVKLEALEEQVMCPVCLDNTNDVTFVSCGHRCCHTCSQKLKKCPLCRKDIRHTIRTYS